jgi:hypothetical protein
LGEIQERNLDNQKTNIRKTSEAGQESNVAVVPGRKTLSGERPLSGALSETSGAFPILWNPRELQKPRIGSTPRKESMALLVKPPKQRELHSLEQIQGIPQGVCLAESKDHPQCLRDSKML